MSSRNTAQMVGECVQSRAMISALLECGYVVTSKNDHKAVLNKRLDAKPYREIEVEVWFRSEIHSCTHYFKGYKSTEPTTFRNITEMKQAICTETTRMDQKPWRWKDGGIIVIHKNE